MFALAGCSVLEADSEPGPSKLRGWATEAELLWLRDLIRWSDQFEHALVRVGELANDPANVRSGDTGEDVSAEFKSRVRQVRECSQGLRRQVGRAPTRRLARTLDILKEACEHYSRAAGLLLLAFRGGGGGAEAEREAERASRLLLRAYDILPPGGAQAVPVVGAKSSETKIDPLYGRVAGEIAKDQAEVRCWSEEDWPRLIQEARVVIGVDATEDTLGVTGVGNKRIHLSPVACRELDRLAYDGEQPGGSEAKLMVAVGVGTLAHEAQHRAGILKEDVAECYAIQSLRGAALSLGADAEYADELATALWDHYPNEPPGYSSPQCRDGGELDLHPETSRWP